MAVTRVAVLIDGGFLRTEAKEPSNHPEKKRWSEVFALLDAAGAPGDLLEKRDVRAPIERESMK